MLKDKAKLYIPAPEIEKMCQRLGKAITHDYKEKDLVVVVVLKGSIIFGADLLRHIDLPLQLDFVRLSSYGEKTESSGVVKVIKDTSLDLRQKHVLVVEDILDTGHTLKFFINHLQASRPASIKVCALLNKPSRRKVDVNADYCGREIEDKFVVGYGLDFQEKCRNYPDIYYFDS